MADYQFDVFVSYERDGLTTGWIMEHFLPLFRTWVRYGDQGTVQPAGATDFLR